MISDENYVGVKDFFENVEFHEAVESLTKETKQEVMFEKILELCRSTSIIFESKDQTMQEFIVVIKTILGSCPGARRCWDQGRQLGGRKTVT